MVHRDVPLCRVAHVTHFVDFDAVLMVLTSQPVAERWLRSVGQHRLVVLPEDEAVQTISCSTNYYIC